MANCAHSCDSSKQEETVSECDYIITPYSDSDFENEKVSGSCDYVIPDYSTTNFMTEGVCSADALDFIPEPDPVDDIKVPDAATVTEELVSGAGVFDIYMRAGMNQLDTQYEQNRIKGSDYAQAYIATMQLMMTEANKMVLGLVQAEIAAKMFNIQYKNAEYDAILKQREILLKETMIRKTVADTNLVCQQEAELSENGATERLLKKEQTIKIIADKNKTITETSLACQQEEELKANGAVERILKKEQTSKIEMDNKKTENDIVLVCQQTAELKANGARERLLKDAQTQVQLKQKDLYDQQITSFKEKTNIDAAKTVYDAWAVNAVEEPATQWEIQNFKSSDAEMTAANKKMLKLANQK